MRHWGSAIFPLSILLALTALTFWLRYATEFPEPRRDGKTRHDPDFIATNTVLRKLDQNGELKYTLKAAEVRHFPDDDSTDLLKPDVVYMTPRKPPLTMSADHGHATQDREQVDLEGNVRIFRPAAGQYEELTATMPQLTVLPDEEKAYTRSPVHITQGKSWVKGIGMKVDNRNQTYVLESHAVAELQSKHAGKPKR